MLRKLNNNRHALNGKRVMITCANRKSKYYETLYAIGSIKNTSNGTEFGILLDNFSNESSAKGLFWFRYDEFEFLKEESEENNMSKLTGFKAVAVVKQGCSVYHFAIFDDGMKYQAGDKVAVSGASKDYLLTIDEVITPEEAAQKYSGNITAEVIDIVNMYNYEERVNKRKAAEDLKKSMDKAIKEMQEVDKYEMYAKQNPALKDMLDQYKKLVG